MIKEWFLQHFSVYFSPCLPNLQFSAISSYFFYFTFIVIYIDISHNKPVTPFSKLTRSFQISVSVSFTIFFVLNINLYLFLIFHFWHSMQQNPFQWLHTAYLCTFLQIWSSTAHTLQSPSNLTMTFPITTPLHLFKYFVLIFL